ncbi:acyl-CoA thioesterase [Silvibacterium dinghuense]|uniref:Thioesterase n=1 Tax=Silvibacterium dinghuense TaxID=1560006 RepID=A0A4Q1SKF0_9BACT|nr:acyl-CoA thioesterase [Silvibacterium dinghuense]RXS97939.1 thioesterase [Silvibacterium dinghuense]GGH03167.1 hypothetical protein GCM10011586_18870 [Silvibacterium dinghuense]
MSHYNSFIRIPGLVIRQKLWPHPRMGVLEADVLRLRVWPQDIDFNFHLNNARYLTFMDYGRTRLMAATGLLVPAVREHWTPLVGSVSITYRRSLGFWAPFTLSTRLMCWDEKWMYMEQVFEGKSGLAAIAWVKGLFRNEQGNIPPQQAIDRVAPGVVSPPMWEPLLQWNELTKEKLASGA